MADRITLKLEPRTTLGKDVKKLRRVGIIPVHLYGRGMEPRSLQGEVRQLIGALAQAGDSNPISIIVEGAGEGAGEEHLAFVSEIQWDPVKGGLFHVDFLRTEATGPAAGIQAPADGDGPEEPEEG